MGLYRRGNVWWYTTTYNGRVVQRSTGIRKKKLATRVYNKIIGEMAERRWFGYTQGDKKTFDELVKKYIKECSILKSDKSYIRDKSLSAHLSESFKEFIITRITPDQISEYKTKRRNEGASSKTINNELGLMHHMYNMAKREWKWCRDNPVSDVSREKVSNQIDRWLSDKEERQLLSKSPKWIKEIVIFALNTGLRQGEILNLKWAQIDLFRKTITIFEQKNKSIDTLPLNENSLKVLKERRRLRSIRGNYVFFNKIGNRINARNLIRSFHAVLRKAKINNFRFHDLRHTFATRLVQSGVDIYIVQKLGRWKSITMVQRYAHHYPESLRRGVSVLD